MFKCEFCNKVTEHNEPCTLIPVEWHEVRQRGVYEKDEFGDAKPKVTREIKREKKACVRCALTHEA